MAATNKKQKIAKRILKEIAIYPSDGVAVLSDLLRVIETDYKNKLPETTEQYEELFKKLEEQAVPPPLQTGPENPLPIPDQPPTSTINVEELLAKIVKINGTGLTRSMKEFFILETLKADGLTKQQILKLMGKEEEEDSTSIPPQTSTRPRSKRNREQDITPLEDDENQEEDEEEDAKKQRSTEKQLGEDDNNNEDETSAQETETVDSLLQELSKN